VTQVVIREVSAFLLEDWLAFFDRDAFIDNREWAGCFCHYYHANADEKDWDAWTSAENRSAASRLILDGQLQGYLAYAGGHPVGWCQAAPRLAIPNVVKDKTLSVGDDRVIGSIVCFVVAPAFRRHGVARSLLESACTGFRKQGLRVAEAYPRPAAAGDAANCRGPLALFLEAGFKTFRELPDLTVVRREL